MISSECVLVWATPVVEGIGVGLMGLLILRIELAVLSIVWGGLSTLELLLSCMVTRRVWEQHFKLLDCEPSVCWFLGCSSALRLPWWYLRLARRRAKLIVLALARLCPVNPMTGSSIFYEAFVVILKWYLFYILSSILAGVQRLALKCTRELISSREGCPCTFDIVHHWFLEILLLLELLLDIIMIKYWLCVVHVRGLLLGCLDTLLL